MNLSSRCGLCVSALAALCMACAACRLQPEFDVVISGGTVYDGTGEVAGVRRADVGLKGDRITAIGDLSGRRASETIDAYGKVVAPGFIDARGQSGLTLLVDRYGESHLRQGITTEIIGDNSPAFWTMRTADAATLQRYGLAFDWNGFGGYFQKLESRGIALNVGTLVPASLARAEAIGADTRAATPADIQVMDAFVDAAMRAGAIGLGAASSRDAAEVNALAAVAGRYGGPFVSPLGTSLAGPEGAEEIISMAAQARTAAVVTDLMLITPPDTMTMAQVVARLSGAGRRGVTAFGTVAPYAPMAEGSDAPAREALKFGSVTIGTNTGAVTAAAAGADTRPAAFGAFPRLLGQWVRDDHVLELREAIRRITSLPANIFHIPQRGIIRETFFADVVVFDPRTVLDRTSPEKPHEYPAGINYVIVNGVITLNAQGLTGSRAGHRLLGPGATRRRPS